MIIGFIVLGVAVLMALGVLCFHKHFEEPIVIILGILFIGTLLAGGTMAISDAAAKKKAEIELVETDITDIYSLNLASTVSGSFTLGTGSVESNFVYAFYIKDDQDLYELRYVKAKITSLKETNERHPCIVCYRERYAKKNWLTMFGEIWLGTTKYIIYVPEGTMVEVYNAIG